MNKLLIDNGPKIIDNSTSNDRMPAGAAKIQFDPEYVHECLNNR
ncbi:MAG TPA: hypothetical protein VMW23_10415 [Sedimentisphaerales bacterium]|nr:hypothetical protein [Sedimentisphaerales bacterium]